MDDMDEGDIPNTQQTLSLICDMEGDMEEEYVPNTQQAISLICDIEGEIMGGIEGDN